MIEYEADDALASAAALAAKDRAVEQVVICTPDKDLAQCVRETRVVQLIRRTGVILDEAAMIAKFGVPPASIPDYLALVGDAADGYPGLPGWGAKSTATVLARYAHIESIPASCGDWHLNVANSRNPRRHACPPTQAGPPVSNARHAQSRYSRSLRKSTNFAGPAQLPRLTRSARLLEKAVIEKKQASKSNVSRPLDPRNMRTSYDEQSTGSSFHGSEAL